MSEKRLVEYVVVAGVKKNQALSSVKTETSGAEYVSSPVSPLSPLSEHVSRRGKENTNSVGCCIPATLPSPFQE